MNRPPPGSVTGKPYVNPQYKKNPFKPIKKKPGHITPGGSGSLRQNRRKRETRKEVDPFDRKGVPPINPFDRGGIPEIPKKV
jgi:hypothetical protein